MGIQTGTVETTNNFPAHDIPADEKDGSWCKQFLSAMYREATVRQPAKIFYAARQEWDMLREYALAQQSVLPYRKWLTGSDSQDKSWVNINWEIPSIGMKYRNIMVNKIMARDFNIVCTPVDPLAIDQTAKWYSDLKAKVMMTKIASKINPELLQTSTLAKRDGDPENMEDFNMRNQLGIPTKLSMDAELGIRVVFGQNNIEAERRMAVEDYVDWGVGLYKDWIDENDKVCFRRVDGMKFISSWCHRKDFKDMVYGGELILMTLSDLAPYFSREVLKVIAENNVGKNGNPKVVPYNFGQSECNKFQVWVLDGEWLSYNTEYYKRSYTTLGNYRFGKKRPDKRDGNATIEVNGRMKPKFAKDDLQVVYKGKWVVDTEYVFDYGLATDQKRKKSSFKKTGLSYHAYAPDFNKMTAVGIVGRMKPFIDKYCNVYFKIQNFLNRWIPYIISIDIAALENIPLGKGGKKLTPMEVLDMLVQTQILVTRKKSAVTGLPEQNKPVEVLPTAMAQEITVLTQELQNTLQGIRDVTGINEVVDGTGPADRTNVMAQQQAQQGSNNAINHFVKGESELLTDLAESLLLRLQRVLKRKPVSGYVHSLGSNFVKFVQVSPDLPLYEYGIFLEDKPETELKQALIQQLAIKDQNGMIQPEDYFMIMNMTNLKEIELKLAYSSKRRLEAQQQAQQANNAQQAQVNAQATKEMEAAKQDTIRIKGEEDRKTEDVKGAWLVKVADRKAGAALDQASAQMIADIILQAMGQQHDVNMAGATGSGGPGITPPATPDQSSADQPQPIPASLQE